LRTSKIRQKYLHFSLIQLILIDLFESDEAKEEFTFQFDSINTKGKMVDGMFVKEIYISV